MGIILPSAYLAPVSYYALLLAHGGELHIEQWEHYVKQTVRNRAVIATEAGRMSLTIPVEHNGGRKTAMRDVRISEHGNWQHLHWQALRAAYEGSPYFEFYCDDLAVFYHDKPSKYLLDFSLKLQQTVCNLISLPWQPQLTDAYQREGDFIDLRNAFNAPAVGGKPYWQVFQTRHGFQPDLSIVDLLFNMGPEALLVLRDYPKDSFLPSPTNKNTQP